MVRAAPPDDRAALINLQGGLAACCRSGARSSGSRRRSSGAVRLEVRRRCVYPKDLRFTMSAQRASEHGAGRAGASSGQRAAGRPPGRFRNGSAVQADACSRLLLKNTAAYISRQHLHFSPRTYWRGGAAVGVTSSGTSRPSMLYKRLDGAERSSSAVKTRLVFCVIPTPNRMMSTSMLRALDAWTLSTRPTHQCGLVPSPPSPSQALRTAAAWRDQWQSGQW